MTAEEQLHDDEARLAESAERERKLAEQVHRLEDELRRLPQAASEVADVQAAVFGIIGAESDELAAEMEAERKYFDEYRHRFDERMNRMQERRHDLLRRGGGNIEEMTRKALLARPEDPRTVQLHKELDDLRRKSEHEHLDYEDQVRILTEKLRLKTADEARMAERTKNYESLQAEVSSLRERLQVRERELFELRQLREQENREQAIREQTLMARLNSLESPPPPDDPSMPKAVIPKLSTNQSREAHRVKLGWMHFK